VVSVNLTADCTSRKNATIVQSPNRLHTTATKSIRNIGEIGTWIWDCKSRMQTSALPYRHSKCRCLWKVWAWNN